MRKKYKSIAAVFAAIIIFSSCADTAGNDIPQTEQTTAFSESAAETKAETTTMTAQTFISEEYNIGGGYKCYVSGDGEKYALHITLDGQETAAMDITEYQAHDMQSTYRCAMKSFAADGIDIPPHFALAAEGTLNYDVYFLADGKIKKAEWYLDGGTQYPIYYVDRAEENNGVIKARLFCRWSRQDRPYPMFIEYAEFVEENGVWKISVLPYEIK